MKYLRNVATLTYYEDRCTGCKRCLQVCPHEVFGFENKKAFIKEKDLCMECGACQKNCSSGALNVKTGVGCSSAIIGSFFSGTDPVCGCDTETASCC